MKVILDSAPDIDAGQTRKPAPKKTLKVKTIAEARRACIAYIDQHNLGGRNWTGGQIIDEDRHIANISYNGRIWHQGTGMEIQP